MATEQEMQEIWQELQKELDAELADWAQAVERALRERSGPGGPPADLGTVPTEPEEE
jgi:hypothetical protein